ncbi:DUF6044 family protein [Paenibacillus pinistramenti]
MGGQYILSAVPVNHAEEDRLHLLKSFNDSQSAWKIYLYQAK